MAELLYDIKVDDPIIEMPFSKNNDEFDNSSSLNSESTNIQEYVKYLEYQKYLLDKYGEDWNKSLTNEEKNVYVDSFVRTHKYNVSEKLLSRFAK